MPYEFSKKKVAPGGGIYAYLPFDNRTKHNKSMFKIGFTTNFMKRESNYHTYLPEGVYRVALLTNPMKPGPQNFTVPKNPEKDKKGYMRYLKHVEKFVFELIEKNGGEILSTNNRPFNEGETEWIFTSQDIIHKAFQKAGTLFGGVVDIYSLTNAFPKRNDKDFVGEIYFKHHKEPK
jgi:hypothetical protein